jgi:hypothetical protein
MTVAGEALNALLLVEFVIEGDGLLRSPTHPESEEEEQKTKANR